MDIFQIIQLIRDIPIFQKYPELFIVIVVLYIFWEIRKSTRKTSSQEPKATPPTNSLSQIINTFGEYTGYIPEKKLNFESIQARLEQQNKDRKITEAAQSPSHVAIAAEVDAAPIPPAKYAPQPVPVAKTNKLIGWDAVQRNIQKSRPESASLIGAIALAECLDRPRPPMERLRRRVVYRKRV
jgi:hypothetical protein